MTETAKDYLQAMNLFAEKKYVEAEKLLRGVLKEDENHLDALEALCVILGNMERFDEGIQTAKEWIEKDPEAIMAFTNLSRYYMKKGMIQEAEDAQAKSRLIGWKMDIREQKAREAAEGKTSPTRPSAPSAEENIEKFKGLVDQDPENILSRFSLGSSYADAMRFKEAAEQFQAVIDLRPDHAAAYLELGKALERFDEPKAVETYEKGIEIANEKGAMLPRNKMQDRLGRLKKG